MDLAKIRFRIEIGRDIELPNDVPAQVRPAVPPHVPSLDKLLGVGDGPAVEVVLRVVVTVGMPGMIERVVVVLVVVDPGAVLGITEETEEVLTGLSLEAINPSGCLRHSLNNRAERTCTNAVIESWNKVGTISRQLVPLDELLQSDANAHGNTLARVAILSTGSTTGSSQ
jgi:hypothetical protein